VFGAPRIGVASPVIAAPLTYGVVGGRRYRARRRRAYQSAVIATCVETAIACANISGITLWHFYDFKVALLLFPK
jgi:hypothetical protein